MYSCETHRLLTDFGVDTLANLAHETHFPWLLSNVYDIITGKPLADGELTKIIDWSGKKVGLCYSHTASTRPYFSYPYTLYKLFCIYVLFNI